MGGLAQQESRRLGVTGKHELRRCIGAMGRLIAYSLRLESWSAHQIETSCQDGGESRQGVWGRRMSDNKKV